MRAYFVSAGLRARALLGTAFGRGLWLRLWALP